MGDQSLFRDEPSAARQFQVLGAVVASIVVTTAALGWLDLDRAHSEARERDMQLLDRTAVALGGVADVLSTTATAQILVDEEGRVQRAQFDAYSAALLQQPGVSSVAYEPRVDADARREFEVAQGIQIVEGTSGTSTEVAGFRDEYFPVLFAAPASLATAIGFDVGSDPVRRAALERARASGEPSATAPLSLAPTDEVGVLVFTPLHPALPSLAETDVIGFLSVAYFADDLIGVLLTGLPARSSVTISDDGEELLVVGELARQPPSTVVPMAGREWTVQVTHPVRASALGAVTVWGMGLLLALFVGAIGLLLIRQNQRLSEERIRTLRLQRVTADMASSQSAATVRRRAVRHVRDIVGSPLAIWASVADGQLVIEEANDAAQEDRVLPYAPALAEAVTAGSVQRVTFDDSGIASLVFSTGIPTEPSAVLAVLDGVEPNERDIALCQAVAVMAGAAKQRAERQEIEHRMAEVLQRQSLPVSVPELQGCTVATAYHPASVHAGIGGDWYDVYDLAPSVAMISVGDAVGHGVPAAGAVGKLRTSMRAVAGVMDPAQTLERLDRLAADIPGGDHAAVLCMILDSEEMTLEYSVAGLPPPLLVRDGASQFLWDGRGPSVGFPPADGRQTARLHLRPGDRLIAYTDGLLAARRHESDQGLNEFAAEARRTVHQPTAEAAAGLVSSLTDVTSLGDDLALVVIDLNR